MKILSLNTWQERGPWRERWEIAFEGIRTFGPDICAFQEIFKESWAQEVRQRTGYASLVFYPEPSGLVLLSRFKVVRSEIFTYQTQSKLEDYKRYAVFAELDTPDGSVFILNTHLSWKPADSETRSAQVRELIGFANEMAGNRQTLITGDFNASPDTAEVRQMAQAGFRDTFSLTNPGLPGLTWDNRNPYAAGASVHLPDRRIDYIFTRGFEGDAASQVVLSQPNEKGVFASDHYGVLTELRERKSHGRC